MNNQSLDRLILFFAIGFLISFGLLITRGLEQESNTPVDSIANSIDNSIDTTSTVAYANDTLVTINRGYDSISADMQGTLCYQVHGVNAGAFNCHPAIPRPELEMRAY